VIGFVSEPTLRGGKLPTSLQVARIFWWQSVIGRRSGAFHHRHRRYSNQGLLWHTLTRAPASSLNAEPQ
jgi:hypothetical protein